MRSWGHEKLMEVEKIGNKGHDLMTSWAFLKFSHRVVANLLCSRVYLFDIIVELHAMDEE